MYYIDALNLSRLAVKHGVLRTHTQMDPETGEKITGILVFVEGKEEPELWDEDYMVHELMTDTEGEKTLLAELAKKGVAFRRYEGSPADEALSTVCEALSDAITNSVSKDNKTKGE